MHVAEALVLLASGVPILCLLAALDKPLELRKPPGERFAGNPVESDPLRTLAVLAGLAAGDIDLVSRFGVPLEAALGFPPTQDTGAMRPLVTLLLLAHGAAHGSGDVDAMHTVFQRLFGDAKRARLACGVQSLMLLPPSSVAEAAVKHEGMASNGGKQGSLQLKADEAEAAVREAVLANANKDKAESEWKAAIEQLDVMNKNINGVEADELEKAKASLRECEDANEKAKEEAFDKKRSAAKVEASLAAAMFVSKEDDEGGAECATATSRRRCLRDALDVLLLDEESNGNAACRAALRCMVGDYRPLEVLQPALHHFSQRKMDVLRGLLLSRSVTTHQIGRKSARKGNEYMTLCRALVRSDCPDHVDALRAALESARGESRELVDLIALMLEGARAAKKEAQDEDDEVDADQTSDRLADWEKAAVQACSPDVNSRAIGIGRGKSKRSNGSKYTAVKVRQRGALLWEIVRGDLLGATGVNSRDFAEWHPGTITKYSKEDGTCVVKYNHGKERPWSHHRSEPGWVVKNEKFHVEMESQYIRKRDEAGVRLKIEERLGDGYGKDFEVEARFKDASVELFRDLLPEPDPKSFPYDPKSEGKEDDLSRWYIARQVVDAIRGIAGVINADERATDELLDLKPLDISDNDSGNILSRKSAAKVMFAAARGHVTHQHIKLRQRQWVEDGRESKIVESDDLKKEARAHIQLW